MKRRRFLTILGAASAAPLLPAGASAGAATAGYNRYMYGVALFHARTRATVSAADIATRMRVSAATAEAMLQEMSLRGAIAPTAGSGVMRAVEAHSQTRKAGATAKRVAKRLVEAVSTDEDEPAKQQNLQMDTPASE